TLVVILVSQQQRPLEGKGGETTLLITEGSFEKKDSYRQEVDGQLRKYLDDMDGYYIPHEAIIKSKVFLKCYTWPLANTILPALMSLSDLAQLKIVNRITSTKNCLVCLRFDIFIVTFAMLRKIWINKMNMN
ncbi:hypothetical protein ACJX0J_031213, partial [Zea mays]